MKEVATTKVHNYFFIAVFATYSIIDYIRCIVHFFRREFVSAEAASVKFFSHYLASF
jgi:hypothetical protein